ncbi:MAG: hypothetical protein LBS30_04030, partial [Planctomycetota bacterium]|nr:hypothetical protein [Planctomycetota bacterium]
MSQDKRNAREQQKHISMDLTADGARVTNLSLQGNRLVLTIEAELADSRLSTGDSCDDALASVPASTPSPEPTPAPAPEPEHAAFSGLSELSRRPKSADAASLGLASPEDAVSGAFSMGSENLPPAPSAAFRKDNAGHGEHMAVLPEAISEPDGLEEDFDFMAHSDPHDHRHDQGHDHIHPHTEMREEPQPV